MRKLILAASLILGLTVMAHAQITKKSPEQRARHMTKVLQKRLNLSRDQASQVNTIFLNRANRMDSLRNNRSADRKENHLAARSIMISTQKQVVAILDDNQKQKFIAWEKKRKDRHKERNEDSILKS